MKTKVENDERKVYGMKTSPKTNEKIGFWSALKCIWLDYIDHTPVHGFFYLRASESTGFERIIWSTVIVASFIVGVILLAHLVAKFVTSPFQITAGHPEMLMRIPFPSISICHSQTVIDFHARNFVDKMKIPNGITKSDILQMLPSALGTFTDIQWRTIDINYFTTINEVLEANRLSVFDTVRAVGMKCPDLIRRCSFNKERFTCFQDHPYLTFRETMSYMGICCSFNYAPDNSSFEPMTINSFGVRGGLSFIGSSFPHLNDGTSGKLFSDGFFLIMHPPYDFPTEYASMQLLEVGKVTLVGIYPTISTLSAAVKALPIASRKCLIGSDVDLPIYRRPACTIQCLKMFIYEKCDCHPYFLPFDNNNSGIRNCTMLDGNCFQKIYVDMKKIRCGSCLPGCEDIHYKMSSAMVSYSYANTSINPMYEATSVTKQEFTAHVYFAGSTVPVRKTVLTVSFVDLLSNLGGVFSLVLGMSAFSILELLYYLCIKLPKSIRKSKTPEIITIHPANNMVR
ncbi:Sodium channel protein Nach [Pseudolycoriella hygida]|uniref:Sodium channel protein Nach n=1 Tax=Pseudolycoriella hygida TaxID=35572 RepID=A0A9Q0MQP0_9DIPT|nr:Sodium channel protein Nach [Pseudolycoriella hygida]